MVVAIKIDGVMLKNLNNKPFKRYPSSVDGIKNVILVSIKTLYRGGVLQVFLMSFKFKTAVVK